MKPLRTLLLAATAMVAAAAPLRAQQPTLRDSLLDRLVGRWVLRGTIQGARTTHDVTAEWVLGHQYVRIAEVSREKNAAGAPEYEADVYVGWDAQARQYVCVWLDVFGGASTESIGRAAPSGDSIPFVFSHDGAESFRNTFAYRRADDAWEWRMDNVKDGARTPFARVTLTRR
jgi:hypothetical protein